MTTTTEPTEAPVEPPVEPFHLIASTTGEELEGMTPLMWCVQPDTSQWFVDKDITDPHLLISVIHDAGEEVDWHRFTEMDRYVVPLKAGLEYIRFSRAGTNIVKATIVWGEEPRPLRKFFLSRDIDNSFKVAVIDSDGDVPEAPTEAGNGAFMTSNIKKGPSGITVYRHAHLTEMTFTISPEVFGKESPKWEREYFGKFTSKSVDECARRGRRLALYPLLLLFLPFQFLVRWVGFGASKFIGFYHLDSAPLFHPFSQGIADIWGKVHPSDDGLFWFKKPSTNRFSVADDRALPFIIMNPLSIVALWAILAFLANLSHSVSHSHRPIERNVHLFHAAWWQSLAWSIGIHLAVLIFIAIVAGAFIVGTALINAMLPESKRGERRSKRDAKKRAKSKSKRAKRLTALSAALHTMTCDTIPNQIGIVSVPKERRTRHMKIQSLKSQVCRPFQR